MEYFNFTSIESILDHIAPNGEEHYGLQPTSIIWKVLTNIKNNNSFNLRDRSSSDGSHHWHESNYGDQERHDQGGANTTKRRVSPNETRRKHTSRIHSRR